MPRQRRIRLSCRFCRGGEKLGSRPRHLYKVPRSGKSDKPDQVSPRRCLLHTGFSLAGKPRSGRGWPRRSSGVAALGPRQLPRSRSHIVSQDVGVIRGRGDPEVPVVRRAPLVNDRKNLDELVPTGEATRRLVAPIARVAVNVNRKCIAHPSECTCSRTCGSDGPARSM